MRTVSGPRNRLILVVASVLALLAAAWLQATALNGALTMAAFGMGTLAVMLPLTWSGARLGGWLQQPGRRNVAAAFVFSAGLLTVTAPWLMQVPALERTNLSSL